MLVDSFSVPAPERKRQARIRNAVAAVFLVLVCGAGLFAWQNYRSQMIIAEIEALKAQYTIKGGSDAAPGRSQGLADAVTAIVKGAATDRRYDTARQLLKEGKPQEAEPLLKSVAEEEEEAGLKRIKQAAEK